MKHIENSVKMDEKHAEIYKIPMVNDGEAGVVH